MYRLVFESPAGTREPFVSREALVLVGREDACQLRLVENGVSDRHAAIEQQSDGYHLRDLRSATGVRVNHQAVTNHRLAPGDLLEIGSVRLRFEAVHPPAPRRRPPDLLQWTATVAVAGAILGQFVVLGRIFTDRRRATSSTVGADLPAPDVGVERPGLSPAPLPPESLPLPAAPEPAAPAPTAPVSQLVILNRMIRVARVDRVDATDQVTLRIQCRAQVGERELDVREVAIAVQPFVLGAAGRSLVAQPVQWLAVGAWENFSSKTFVARLGISPPEFVGFVVRTYYRGQLQDQWATPSKLVSLAPEPGQRR